MMTIPLSTIFYTPLNRPLLATILETTKREAMEAYAEEYARRSGYTRGPQGEWITDRREAHH